MKTTKKWEKVLLQAIPAIIAVSVFFGNEKRDQKKEKGSVQRS